MTTNNETAPSLRNVAVHHHHDAARFRESCARIRTFSQDPKREERAIMFGPEAAERANDDDTARLTLLV